MLPERDLKLDCVANARWPRYQPMVLVLVAFATGVSLDRLLDLSWGIEFVIACSGLLGWCGLARIRNVRSGSADLGSGRNERLGSTLLLIGLIGAGAFWQHGRWNWLGSREVGRFATSQSVPCCVDATAISEPRWVHAGPSGEANAFSNEDRTKLTVRVQRIRDRDQWVKSCGIVDLVIHKTANHIRSGDRIRVFGRLVASSPPSNPGQFDFQKFYRGRSKLAFLHAYELESVQVIKPATWWHVPILSRLRHDLNELTWRFVDHRQAGFASAILLGNREQLSSQRRETFLETGTVHLLAISGLHVGILAGVFFLFFRIGWLNRRHCLWLTILFVFFYAWLVEFRPPVSRAAILITLFCLGRLWGERNFSFNLLAIAGLIVLAINPSDLFALGPQLSFLAVAALIFGNQWVFWPPPSDPIKRLIANTRPGPVRVLSWMGRQFRTAILVSGLIWLVAMPLVAYRFHLVAPVALVVNPLLLIPIAWGLYGGLGVLVFGRFLPPVAQVSGWFCERNLAFIEWLIGAAQAVPFGHAWTAGPTSWALVLFYAGVLVFAVYPPTRISGRWIAALAVGWLMLAWILPDQLRSYRERWQANQSPLVCTFIDVGHGTSVLLQLPDGQNVLYDAGSMGSAEYGARSIAAVLWSERIERLDAIILSHADIDHFNALFQLADQFAIDVVCMTRQMSRSDSPAVKQLLSVLGEKGVPVQLISSSDPLSFRSEAGLKVLGPPAHGVAGNDNANSVVLLIDYLGTKIMLPGDLEGAGLERLLQSDPIDLDLVLAAHHGSGNSLPRDFMDWSSPEYVVISGGSQRVNDQMVQRFEPEQRSVARTDIDGAIRFIVDRAGVRLLRWTSQPW